MNPIVFLFRKFFGISLFLSSSSPIKGSKIERLQPLYEKVRKSFRLAQKGIQKEFSHLVKALVVDRVESFSTPSHILAIVYAWINFQKTFLVQDRKLIFVNWRWHQFFSRFISFIFTTTLSLLLTESVANVKC